ncbi:MAG: hypothetical protein D6732_17250 [Methanobacteriota archaeon]|nr:MAG: hypothetical protein D6732_17250 [Euryarchaeota archaeon]
MSKGKKIVNDSGEMLPLPRRSHKNKKLFSESLATERRRKSSKPKVLFQGGIIPEYAPELQGYFKGTDHGLGLQVNWNKLFKDIASGVRSDYPVAVCAARFVSMNVASMYDAIKETTLFTSSIYAGASEEAAVEITTAIIRSINAGVSEAVQELLKCKSADEIKTTVDSFLAENYLSQKIVYLAKSEIMKICDEYDLPDDFYEKAAIGEVFKDKYMSSVFYTRKGSYRSISVNLIPFNVSRGIRQSALIATIGSHLETYMQETKTDTPKNDDEWEKFFKWVYEKDGYTLYERVNYGDDKKTTLIKLLRNRIAPDISSMSGGKTTKKRNNRKDIEVEYQRSPVMQAAISSDILSLVPDKEPWELGERFADEFGFLGVEFGNYTQRNKNDQLRDRFVVGTWGALELMSRMLARPKSQTGLLLDDKPIIGLCYGSRGSGRNIGHMRPYEDKNFIEINLIRDAVGALLHEYAHSLSFAGHLNGILPKTPSDKIFDSSFNVLSKTALSPHIVHGIPPVKSIDIIKRSESLKEHIHKKLMTILKSYERAYPEHADLFDSFFAEVAGAANPEVSSVKRYEIIKAIRDEFAKKIRLNAPEANNDYVINGMLSDAIKVWEMALISPERLAGEIVSMHEKMSVTVQQFFNEKYGEQIAGDVISDVMTSIDSSCQDEELLRIIRDTMDELQDIRIGEVASSVMMVPEAYIPQISMSYFRTNAYNAGIMSRNMRGMMFRTFVSRVTKKLHQSGKLNSDRRMELYKIAFNNRKLREFLHEVSDVAFDATAPGDTMRAVAKNKLNDCLVPEAVEKASRTDSFLWPQSILHQVSGQLDGESKQYFRTPEEIWARLVEYWGARTLEEAGLDCDFLVSKRILETVKVEDITTESGFVDTRKITNPWPCFEQEKDEWLDYTHSFLREVCGFDVEYSPQNLAQRLKSQLELESSRLNEVAYSL